MRVRRHRWRWQKYMFSDKVAQRECYSAGESAAPDMGKFRRNQARSPFSRFTQPPSRDVHVYLEHCRACLNECTFCRLRLPIANEDACAVVAPHTPASVCAAATQALPARRAAPARVHNIF